MGPQSGRLPLDQCAAACHCGDFALAGAAAFADSGGVAGRGHFRAPPGLVESVSWITERKNVLSAVFYFAAALAYLRFVALAEPGGPNRHRRYWYLGALVLFMAALLSKTVTCTLPAALLLVCWWKKGRVQRGDIFPLLPFFALGVGLGLLTAWIEKYHVGAQGAEWSLTFADRCLIAGRALWFYAGKLVWPAHLTFIYPRWEIDPAVWWQWLFPVAAVGVVAGLWLARRRIGRGPLVAVLFFAGTLGPALGFVNVYPMRYSFVADHFQYLACVGLITLCAAGLDRIPRVIPATLVVLLGALTWQQTGIYRNLETLWRDTLAKNPGLLAGPQQSGHLLVSRGASSKRQWNTTIRPSRSIRTAPTRSTIWASPSPARAGWMKRLRIIVRPSSSIRITPTR